MEQLEGKGSYVELRTICPADGSSVVVHGTSTHTGMHIAHCSRWTDGFTCQSECAGQVGLEYSVQLARQVQEMLEPPATVRLGELSVATWMSVSHLLGGDFQVVRADGPILRLLQGDVVGKGLCAAVLAAYLVGMYDALATRELRPAQLLSCLNNAVLERTQARPMFATVMAIEVDLARRTWVSARAGHECPWLVRTSGEVVSLNQEAGLPVGVQRNEIYPEQELPLLQGDRLFVGSDGTQEVGLTTERVVSTLHQQADSVNDLMQSLVSQLQPLSHRDDITMAIIGCAPRR